MNLAPDQASAHRWERVTVTTYALRHSFWPMSRASARALANRVQSAYWLRLAKQYTGWCGEETQRTIFGSCTRRTTTLRSGRRREVGWWWKTPSAWCTDC